VRPAPREINLELRPQARFDLINVADQVRAKFGEVLARFPRSLYCSHHTTAGYLEQSLCARLSHSPERVNQFLRVFHRLFPTDAGYQHDNLPLREELSADQRQHEPRNAASHLTFIGSGLRNCATYANRPDVPVYFIDLDGVNSREQRRRLTTVVSYHSERIVEQLEFAVSVSRHAVDSINLKDQRLGLFDHIRDQIALRGIGSGRVDIALMPGEKFAGLTVNEYETLLMRHDLSEVLRNPFRFMAEKGKHILQDPLAVPHKALNYAAFDVVHVFNELLDLFRISESKLERLLARATGSAASRFLRLRRTIQLPISSQTDGGQPGIIQGPYQSPILIQWRHAPARNRRLRITLVEFE
jgi:thiamine phosphate synthase YjbQ (UPF0047 family)